MWIMYFAAIVATFILSFLIVCLTTEHKKDNFGFNKDNSQMLKGIAICCVFVCHYMGNFGDGTVTLFTPLGGIGVAIFLLLSAYGLNESWNRNGATFWWRKRFVAVFLPYILVQLLCYWTTHDFSLLSFLKDIFLISPLHNYGWYLNHLLLWYILFYIVMRVSLLRKYKILIFTIISVCMFFCLRELRAEQSLSFLAGILLSEYKQSTFVIKTTNWKYGLLLLLLGVSFLALKQIPFIREMPQILFNLVQLMIKFPCGLGVCFIAIDLAKKINMKLFVFVGSFSYELYLLHGYAIQYTPHSLMGAVICISASVVAAILLHWFLSKANNLNKTLLRIK